MLSHQVISRYFPVFVLFSLFVCLIVCFVFVVVAVVVVIGDVIVVVFTFNANGPYKRLLSLYTDYVLCTFG